MAPTPRHSVAIAIAEDNYVCPEPKRVPGLDSYGKEVFSTRVMRERLPKGIFRELQQCIKNGEPLTPSIADVVASSMKDWAIERGATHYTHWFQPMTGMTAEKHDAFITCTAEGDIINSFSGKMLIKSEPDASSFPSGGIRSTFEARGYTDWDPTSPAFLMENAYGKTLYIPSIFVSYTGESLDRKTPLLRSVDAVGQQALRILRLFGNTKATSVGVMVGAEQEYFLVDRRHYKLRLDLQLAGRTLYGVPSCKGQEHQYFGSINLRVLAFMAEVEERLIALGVPAKTRHNESAPSQFELAPLYEDANLATDHNMLTMEILRVVAEKHNFACVLHEKPFAEVNGSGKHNNWSLSDSEGNNLLEPGKTPQDNAQFLVFLAAVLRAVHKYPELLRLGSISAGNDRRLGGHEAPPAILSVFLGSTLTELLEAVITGCTKGCGWDGGTLQVGVSALAALPRDISDRNRTSPFAFTGNKFEFRAVGSSMSVAPANIAICAAVACALDDIATMLEADLAKGVEFTYSVQSLLAKLFKEHMPVVFNGNGYSKDWIKEAKKRGLPNLPDTVAALLEYDKAKVKEGFYRHGILTERELLARQEILLESYIKSVAVEANVTSVMGRSQIFPATVKWLDTLGSALRHMEEFGGSNSDSPERAYFVKVQKILREFLLSLDKLDKQKTSAEKLEDSKEHAIAVRDKVIPIMDKCREYGDALELLVDDSVWPFPKYDELLW